MRSYKAALYARNCGGEGISISEQLRLCKETCKRRQESCGEFILITEYYIDCFSSINKFERLYELLEDCRKSLYDMVVIASEEIFGKSRHELTGLAVELYRIGSIYILMADNPFDEDIELTMKRSIWRSIARGIDKG